jgi:hypothetical protein
MHRTSQNVAADRPAGTATRTALPDLLGDRLRSALGLATDAAPPAEATSSERSGLPMPRLRSPARESTTHYAVTSIDLHGRFGDRSPIQVMGWGPGHPIAFSLTAGAIMVVSRPDANEAITRQGHLRLSASMRHASRLKPGDRLLVAAYPHAGLLVAYTTADLDQMVRAYHTTHRPGGAR